MFNAQWNECYSSERRLWRVEREDTRTVLIAIGLSTLIWSAMTVLFFHML